MGTLDEMRHLSALSVDAILEGPAPDGLSNLPGVRAVEVNGQRVRCQVEGSIEPLLRRLTDVGVTHLVSKEPSLEELFLTLYGKEDGVS